MSLEIVSIKNGSTPEEEYILLKAIANIMLSNYAIIDVTFADEKVYNIHRHFFRFPSQSVGKDEYVVLFTGKYRSISKEHQGRPLHTLFWKMGRCIWNDSNTDRVEVLQVKTMIQKLLAKTTK